jgi:hypothetical protein
MTGYSSSLIINELRNIDMFVLVTMLFTSRIPKPIGTDHGLHVLRCELSLPGLYLGCRFESH